MKIGIGCDHAAFHMKEEVAAYLKELGHEVADFGTHSEKRCDYPIYGEKVAWAVAEGQVERGVLICGTGVGISLAANKLPGIRAAVCSEPVTARLSRAHNDVQIIAFGARIVGMETAKAILDAFLNTPFEGGRHQERLALISRIEKDIQAAQAAAD